MKKLNKNEKTYKTMMQKNYKKLKLLLDDEVKSEIEFINNGETSYDAFRWQKKLIRQIRIYITYLGYIDSLIVDINQSLNFYSDDEIHLSDIDRLKKEYEEIMQKRNKLLNLIKDNTSMIVDLNFADEVLNEVPSLSKFNLIYNDLKINEYQLNLQAEFIEAYNLFFLKRNKVRSECIEQTFNQYQKLLTEHNEQNEEKIEQAKILKKAL